MAPPWVSEGSARAKGSAGRDGSASSEPGPRAAQALPASRMAAPSFALSRTWARLSRSKGCLRGEAQVLERLYFILGIAVSWNTTGAFGVYP